MRTCLGGNKRIVKMKAPFNKTVRSPLNVITAALGSVRINEYIIYIYRSLSIYLYLPTSVYLINTHTHTHHYIILVNNGDVRRLVLLELGKE